MTKIMKVKDILNIIEDCSDDDSIFFYHESAREEAYARDIVVAICDVDASDKIMKINMYEVNNNFDKKVYLI